MTAALKKSAGASSHSRAKGEKTILDPVEVSKQIDSLVIAFSESLPADEETTRRARLHIAATLLHQACTILGGVDEYCEDAADDARQAVLDTAGANGNIWEG